jgi:large subunit ribosomal protein L22
MRIAPRKARLVAATVVGLRVKDALTILQFTPRAAAKEVAKVVKSAAANATNNFSQDEDSLVVKSIVVNEGPTLKRGRPRARGMYFSIFKRTSHITAVVDAAEIAPVRRTRTRAATPTVTETEPAAKKPRGRAAKAEAKPESKAETKPESKAEEPEVEALAEEERAASAEAEAAEVAEEPVAEAEAGEQPKSTTEEKS